MDLGLVILLAVVVALAAVIVVGVYVTLRARSGSSGELTFRTVLVGYFYLMSLVAFLFLAFGAATLLKAGLSDVFGRSFSYAVPGVNFPEPVERLPGTMISPEEQRRRDLDRVEQQYRNELVQGTVATVIGALLWPVHVLGRRRLMPNADAFGRFLGLVFLIIPLLVFSLVGIASLIMAVYQLLNFVLNPPDGLIYREAPGGTLATALVFVPLWLAYLGQAIRRVAQRNGGPVAPVAAG